MSSAKNDEVMAGAERDWISPPEYHDHLDGKPEGFCTWCGEMLLQQREEDHEALFCFGCPDYDPDDTEPDNRARYAKEREREEVLYLRTSRACMVTEN